MEQARVAQIWVTWLFLAALAVEFFFAGAGAFGAADWDLHRAYGWFLTAASVLLLVVAAVARRLIPLSAALVAVMIVQWLLATLGEDASEWLGALHGLNALVAFGVAMTIAVRAQRVRIATGEPPSAGPQSRA
jgi:hypothetical protein